MKKILYLSMLTLVACNADEPPSQFQQDLPSGDALQTSIYRTPEDAAEIARSAMNDFYPSRSRSRNTIPLGGVNVITSHPSRGETDTLLYVVNFDDNGGFAIVNGRTIGTSLYGISDKGTYDAANKDLNPPGLNLFIEATAQGLPPKDSLVIIEPGTGGDDGKEPFMQQKYVRDTIENVYIKPKLNVEWGQTLMWGKHCPNYVCGCAPLALFQALTYFKQPAKMTFKCPDIPYSSIELPWDTMIKECPFDMPTFCSTVPASQSINLSDIVGYVAREFGYNMDAEYLNPELGTSVFKDEFFDYSKQFISEQCKSLTTTDLYYSSRFSPADFYYTSAKYYEDGVFLMSGQLYDNQTSLFRGGHAWVVDGYRGYEVKSTYYIKYDNEIAWRVFQEDVESYRYVHVNWGWFGDANGWYYSDDYGRLTCSSKDNEGGVMHPGYNYAFYYMNIYPIGYTKL